MAEHQHASGDGRPHRRVASHWRWRPEWTPGRTALWWYLTFEEHPLLAETGRGLGEALRHEPGLDLNPGRWLHLTLREVGFVDEVPDRAVVDCVAATRRSLHDAGPVTVRTDGTGVLPGAVVRWVEPDSEVVGLREAVVGLELPPAAGADEVAPEVVRPHVSIAYARSDLDASDVVALLPQPVEVAVPVSHVVFAAVTRRRHHYEWQVCERVPLGRGRSTPAEHRPAPATPAAAGHDQGPTTPRGGPRTGAAPAARGRVGPTGRLQEGGLG